MDGLHHCWCFCTCSAQSVGTTTAVCADLRIVPLPGHNACAGLCMMPDLGSVRLNKQCQTTQSFCALQIALDRTELQQQFTLACALHLFWAVLNHRTSPSGQTQRCQNQESTTTVSARLPAAAIAPVSRPLKMEICLVSSMWRPISPARGTMSHLNTICSLYSRQRTEVIQAMTTFTGCSG